MTSSNATPEGNAFPLVSDFHSGRQWFRMNPWIFFIFFQAVPLFGDTIHFFPVLLEFRIASLKKGGSEVPLDFKDIVSNSEISFVLWASNLDASIAHFSGGCISPAIATSSPAQRRTIDWSEVRKPLLDFWHSGDVNTTFIMRRTSWSGSRVDSNDAAILAVCSHTEIQISLQMNKDLYLTIFELPIERHSPAFV